MESTPQTPATLADDPLAYWVQRLDEREMPAFAHTTRLITGTASRGDSSASELARVILQDVSVTTRLLRMANSIFYNPTRTPITTVTRAIVLLGFETVRNLCLSISILDSLVEGEHREQVTQDMARSFHAAVQARTLARKRGDPSPEEVFIATLLHHLGRMAFWCFARNIVPEAPEQLRRALSGHTGPTAEVERSVLGFSLKELTARLNREWHLSTLLDRTLERGPNEDPRTGNVVLGHELAEAAEQGWDRPETKALLERAAESLYLPLEEVKRLVRDNAQEAAATMARLGAHQAGRKIPVPDDTPFTETQEEPVPASGSAFPEPDAELQLRILRELSEAMLEGSPDVNVLLEMVLEGIYRGIGMDRCVFAIRSSDSKAIRAKFALGWDRQPLLQRFHFSLRAQPPNIMDHMLANPQPLWVSEKSEASVRRKVTPEIEEVTGDSGFFVMGLAIEGKSIGVLYADRRPSRRALDDDAFTSFRLFGQQAQLGLAHARRK